MSTPRVLMVTGAYHPETSGASLQCRQLVRALRDRVDFRILTTTTDSRLHTRDEIDGVAVSRIYVDPASGVAKATATLRMTAALMRLRSQFDVVHLHGFSQKTLLVIMLARALRKRVVIKLTSAGHDDARTMRQQGGVRFRLYASADRFIGVAPHFEDAHRAIGLPPDRFRLIPNGVDLNRFRPSDPAERPALRAALGLPAADPMILFVGFFSHEKQPDLLYRAWVRLTDAGTRATLVFIGVTRAKYHEIDPAMSSAIRADAERRGLAARLAFVEHTGEIEKYYRAADIFALPTLREGLPNVLLEAMASGIPAVITRLPGVTDWIVDESRTGCLVPPNDEMALTDALARLLADEPLRRAIGHAAREHVAERFRAEMTAERTLALYRELLTCAA